MPREREVGGGGAPDSPASSKPKKPTANTPSATRNAGWFDCSIYQRLQVLYAFTRLATRSRHSRTLALPRDAKWNGRPHVPLSRRLQLLQVLEGHAGVVQDLETLEGGFVDRIIRRKVNLPYLGVRAACVGEPVLHCTDAVLRTRNTWRPGRHLTSVEQLRQHAVRRFHLPLRLQTKIIHLYLSSFAVGTPRECMRGRRAHRMALQLAQHGASRGVRAATDQVQGISLALGILAKAHPLHGTKDLEAAAVQPGHASMLAPATTQNSTASRCL
jgi:hypothetical protein